MPSKPPSSPEDLKAAVGAQRLSEALRLKAAPRSPPSSPPAPRDERPALRGRIGPPPVKHINQARPDGAPASYIDRGYCGPTCMAMIARAYELGSQLTDAELVQRLANIASAARGGGTDRTGLFRMASHLRLQSQDWNGEATFWMARHLEQGRYVMAAGNPYALPPFVKVERFGNHFIVVDGMDEDGNFLMKNPWPDGEHVVSPGQMWKFLMTIRSPYQYAFWR